MNNQRFRWLGKISVFHLQASVLLLTLPFGVPYLSADDSKKKVIFISGKPSHGPAKHEHRAGNILLAKRLNAANLGIEAVVLSDIGYPKNPKVLEDAASIVIFCTGHQGHVVNPHLRDFDAIMKRGTGVVMIHWATEAAIGMQGKKFLEWMGGYCALNWSVNPHWKPEFKIFPNHPVSQGLTPFSLDDEWYYHMRFVPELKGVTPILSAVPSLKTLKRPDGPRSGNPTVRRAVANQEPQHVAWCYDRPDGKGRGFGFTGAHNHSSWQDDNFRKVVLNAIAWTAYAEVPKGGVPSETPSDVEIALNLDSQPPKKKTPPKAFTDIPELQAARAGKIRQMDLNLALSKLFKTLDKTNDESTQSTLLSGMLLGLEGQRNIKPPNGWFSTKQKLVNSDSQKIRSMAGQLSQIFGDEAANRKALSLLKNKANSIESRRLALASLVSQRYSDLAPALKGLLEEPALRIEVIRAYSTFESTGAPKILLDLYPNYSVEEQRVVIETLATRKSYAEALLVALEQQKVNRKSIPAYVDRSLQALLGKRYTDKYASQSMPPDKEAEIERYKKLITPEKLAKADASHGRAVYQRACAACHKMYDAGGIVGPDLTGSNRANLDYLFLNILYPDFDIPDAYKMVLITTNNKQLLVGSIKEENDQKVVLNSVGQLMTIAKSDIVNRETSPGSMMPAGLLQTLSEEEVLNLVKYFQTKNQVDLPK